MPTDRSGDPWPGSTYKGFAGGASADRPGPGAAHSTPRPRPTRALVIGGVAGALGLGLLFGFLARPELIGSRPATTTTTAPVASPPGAAQVPIAVAPPSQPEPPPRAPGRLETLPPEMAAAARLERTPRPSSQPASRAASPPPTAAAPQSSPVITEAPEAVEPAPAPRARASFDCATARPGAEELVCSDDALAAADRQMARIYSRALRSGIDPRDLRQEQRDWVAIREDAARHSRRALAAVYDQRIRELTDIAEGGAIDEE